MAPSRTYFAFCFILLPRFVGWSIESSGPESDRRKDVSNVSCQGSDLTPTYRHFPCAMPASYRQSCRQLVPLESPWLRGSATGSRFRHVGGRVREGFGGCEPRLTLGVRQYDNRSRLYPVKIKVCEGFLTGQSATSQSDEARGEELRTADRR